MAKTTIPAGYFAAGSIATADIADDAVTADKLAANSVVSASIVNGTIATADLADDAITSAKIADNAITAAMVPNATALTLDGGLTVDNITINGTEIDLSSGDLTVDVAGNLILAPGTDEVRLVGGSNDTAFGKFYASSGNFYINMPTQDKDIIFSGNDGGASITAMTIDMSEGGRVGIGNTSPGHILHIQDTDPVVAITTDADGEAAELRLMEDAAGTQHGGFLRYEGNGDYVQIGHYNSGTEMIGLNMDESGDIAIGATNAFGTTSNRTCVSVNGTSSVSLNVGTGGSQRAYMYSDGSSAAVSTVGSIPLKLGVNDQNKTATLNTSGQFSAENIYDGATGSETQIVNFPCTSTYPNVSTYTFSLSASQAPLGSRVIMGIRISCGSHGGDQYMYLTQNNGKGPGLYQFVGTWYYNDGAMSMYKIDATGDRNFTVTHGTIVATNSNDFRRVYYYGYIMDN